MPLAQAGKIRWPLLFIAKNDTFFHVVANAAEPMQHALADIQKWVGRGHLSPGRADDHLAEVDVFDRDRRRLVLVTGKAGVSVVTGPHQAPESKEVLLRRLNTVVAMLKKASSAIPEAAAKNLPLTVRGYADYLVQVSAVLENAPEQHNAPARHDMRVADEGPVLLAPQVAVQFPAADLPVTAGVDPIPDSRGWFHNLMHQAWG